MTLVPVKTLQIDTYCKNTYKIPLYIWYALVLAEGAFLVMMMMMVMTIVMVSYPCRYIVTVITEVDR